MEPPTSNDSGDLSSSKEWGSRSQSFSVLMSRNRDHKVLRIQNRWEMRSLTSRPRNLLASGEDGRNMIGVRRVKSKQADCVMRLQMPQLQQS